MTSGCIHTQALEALMENMADEKARLATDLYAAWREGRFDPAACCCQAEPPRRIEHPGRPSRPVLVPPSQVPQRRLTTEEGRFALIHAVTHIEFNAINLALDAVYRFRGMPSAFYGDWLRVAAEEAEHFGLLRRRLRDLGGDYGDLPAHNGLWEMALDTDDDVLVRMALVPRVLEARGLDVTPGMMQHLAAAGDTVTVQILRIILRDEIGHVAIGTRWYTHACEQRGLEPVQTFQALLARVMQGRLRGPFNVEARLQAGFTEHELAQLARLEQSSTT